MQQNGAPRRAQEKTGSARSPLGIILDRHLFLNGLQYQQPDFWRGFHQSMHHLPVSERQTVEQWAEIRGVVDPWFVDVLKDTDADWRTHPDSPRTRLLDGSEWFTYRERDHDVLPFAPEFENPRPMLMGESRTLETPDEFEERMAGQFQQAMKEYKAYIRPASASQSEQSLGNRRRDAHWAALRFVGKSSQEIAQGFPGMMDRDRYDDPEDAIRKATKRFSAGIELTLRSR